MTIMVDIDMGNQRSACRFVPLPEHSVAAVVAGMGREVVKTRCRAAFGFAEPSRFGAFGRSIPANIKPP
jgi:hypothetical protein